ncbi:phosphotransferase family protein [Pseudacidovorax intermedius]|uniref:phosphotransferase family protein n=1 Tax=Pseudacidovorax intermedius TaxID=433924 RepID=UPI0026F1331F|nr:phosphotransferase family protein [Pseudacidovorax intermedius]
MTPPALDLSAPVLVPRLAAFLATSWGRPVAIDALHRFAAGMSWITLGFTATLPAHGGAPAETRALILRVGDPAGLLAPYRAEPEYHVLAALEGRPALPVPRVFAFSDDPAVIGAPFLVAGRVEGDTPMPWKGAAEARGEALNASLAADFVDGLAALHRVDWRATPLARLWGPVDAAGVARAQVDFWWMHAGLADADAAPPPQMHHARRWLQRHAPVAPRVAIVHGDYRVGNFLQQAGRITAVLDWELVHAGDPHEDLAWAALRVFSGGTGRVGGLMTREAFLARYAAQAGFEPDLRVLHYYEVLGLFKSASMLMGAAQRVQGDQACDVRMASMGFQVASTLLELNRLLGEAP